MIDHFTRDEETGRAVELDPATFSPEPTGIDWFNLTVWLGLFCLSGLAWWGIVAGVSWVWGVLVCPR